MADVLEQIRGLGGGSIEDEALHPSPALGQQAPHRGRGLGQLAHHRVEALIDLPGEPGQAVHQRRALREQTGPEQEAGDHEHGDDQGEQHPHRHAPADGQRVGPRDRRAQQVGEGSGEEHGQQEAPRQPQQRDEPGPAEEPEGLHRGAPGSGPAPGNTGVRRA